MIDIAIEILSEKNRCFHNLQDENKTKKGQESTFIRKKNKLNSNT
jgi:hypothetical protein